jgi:hypothetical protein
MSCHCIADGFPEQEKHACRIELSGSAEEGTSHPVFGWQNEKVRRYEKGRESKCLIRNQS